MPTPTERILVLLGIAVLALGAFAVPASAQANEVSLDVSKPTNGVLTADGTTELTTNVTAGCGLVLTSTDATATLALGDDAPDWLSSDGATVTFAASDCAGGTTTARKEVKFPVTTSASAPGLTATEFTVTVTLGSASDDAKVSDVMVDYMPGYSLDPSGDQTFEVTGETYSFNLTITISANAKTMTMFENLAVDVGTVDGLNANIYDVAGGQTEDRRTITFKAPDFAWTQSNVTFYTYGHCLDGGEAVPCGPTFEQNITWTFVNAAPATETETDGGDETEESPAIPVVPLVLLGALLVALVRRR